MPEIRKVKEAQIMASDTYQRAWQRLLKEIQHKTGWGNVELQKLMLDCLVNPDKESKGG